MTALQAFGCTILFTAATLLLARLLLGKARHDPGAEEAEAYDPYLARCSAKCCRGSEAVHPADVAANRGRNHA